MDSRIRALNGALGQGRKPQLRLERLEPLLCCARLLKKP